MVKMIRPDQISFRATVKEEELRERLALEVLDSIGALGPDDKPLPGVVFTVKRGDGRAGGYVVEVSGPAPVRIGLPMDGRGATLPK